MHETSLWMAKLLDDPARRSPGRPGSALEPGEQLMADYGSTEEQEHLRKTAETFAREAQGSSPAHHDATATFPMTS